jgi:hypothetical protein
MDYVPSSSGCEPTPCLHPALPDEGRGFRWVRQNQAITKDTKSTVETIALRSEIEEKKKKNKQPNQ